MGCVEGRGPPLGQDDGPLEEYAGCSFGLGVDQESAFDNVIGLLGSWPAWRLQQGAGQL
jgi:hypothetical protein